MSRLEELLQDYIICSNDMNGLSFYSTLNLDNYINQKNIDAKEISKESVLKKLENNNYKIADIYDLLSEGKITAADIVKHTSIEVYDMLMDELKDFDKNKKNDNDNDKITGNDISLNNKKEIIKEGTSSKNSEEMILEMSKKVMDFLTDAKEILVIKK